MHTRIAVRIVALLVAAALVCCFSSCGFLSADTQKQVEKIQQDIAELGKKIATEQDPAAKERFQNDMKEAQKKLGELLKKLVEEGKKIDVKGMFDGIQKEVDKATGSGK